MLVVPKIEITRPCCRRGNTSSRIDWPSGWIGAPLAPCTRRQATRPSSVCAIPHMTVEKVKPARLQNWTRPRPKRVTSHPVMGMTTAVARIWQVTVQETSSWVADIAPCTCGRMAATENVAALKEVDAATTVTSTKMRRDRASGSAGWSFSAVTPQPVLWEPSRCPMLSTSGLYAGSAATHTRPSARDKRRSDSPRQGLRR